MKEKKTVSQLRTKCVLHMLSYLFKLRGATTTAFERLQCGCVWYGKLQTMYIAQQRSNLQINYILIVFFNGMG